MLVVWLVVCVMLKQLWQVVQNEQYSIVIIRIWYGVVMMGVMLLVLFDVNSVLMNSGMVISKIVISMLYVMNVVWLCYMVIQLKNSVLFIGMLCYVISSGVNQNSIVMGMYSIELIIMVRQNLWMVLVVSGLLLIMVMSVLIFIIVISMLLIMSISMLQMLLSFSRLCIVFLLYV